MNKTITTFIAYISLLIFLASTSSCLSEQQKIDNFINDFNKSCPIEEQSIRIEGAKLEPEKTIRIDITMTSPYIDNSEFSKNSIKEVMREIYLKLLQTDKEFKTIKSTNATFHYVFNTIDGEYFTDLRITPEEYNAPQSDENKITGSGINNDAESILNIMVGVIKKQLPMVDEETGLHTVDCYIEGKTMVTVALIPDSVFSDYADKEEFEQIVTNYMKDLARSSMQKAMDYGISIRYIYKKENGDIHADITIGKDDL